MRHGKIGFAAAVLAASIAVFSAGTASATVFCKNGTNPCTSKYGIGTEVTGYELAGTSVEFKSKGLVDNCEASVVNGKTSTAGSEKETVEFPIASLTLGNCQCEETKVKANGSLVFHYDSNGAGLITGDGTRFEFKCAGMVCEYGTVNQVLGEIKRPANNLADTTMIFRPEAIPKTGGAILCPVAIEYFADYTIKTPIPLYVAEK